MHCYKTILGVCIIWTHVWKVEVQRREGAMEGVGQPSSIVRYGTHSPIGSISIG